MENRDGVIILETETDIAFKEHFDKIVKSLEDKCRENIQLSGHIKDLQEKVDYWEKANDRLQEQNDVLIIELESAKGNLGMIIESDTKDIIRLNEKISQLEFELKAADADYQKQIKHLKIQYSNDLNEACSYLDSVKGSVDKNGAYYNMGDFIGEVISKLKKSLDDNLNNNQF